VTSQTSFRLPLLHKAALKYGPLASVESIHGSAVLSRDRACAEHVRYSSLETASYPPLTLALVWASGSDF
jgi:hypothetical protein